VSSPAGLTLPTATTPLDPAQERALRAVTLRKVSRRLLPFLFVLYVCAFLDRINVGYAALHMDSDLGFSATAYGLGSGMGFLGSVVADRVAAAARGGAAWGSLSGSGIGAAEGADLFKLKSAPSRTA
jgi:hypothetical protein